METLIRDIITQNKSVINYLPRCSYHLHYGLDNQPAQVSILRRFVPKLKDNCQSQIFGLMVKFGGRKSFIGPMVFYFWVLLSNIWSYYFFIRSSGFGLPTQPKENLPKIPRDYRIFLCYSFFTCFYTTS